jgi:TPR repeat protein
MNNSDFSAYILDLIKKCETSEDSQQEYNNYSVDKLQEGIYFSPEFVQNLESNSNSHHALTLLGVYYNSPGHEKKALEYFHKADELARSKKTFDIKAMLMLMDFYNKGIGTKQDLEMSFKFTKELAELGVVECKHNLSGLYYQGKGTPQDYKKAFQVANEVMKETNYGIPPNVFLVAQMYSLGQGTKKDTAEALKLFSRLKPNI